MSAFLSLTKKELRLGVPVFLVPIIIFIVAVGVAAYFGGRSGVAWEAIAVVSVSATAIQIFYLLYYLSFSLKSERKKLHLWLHNPLPGYSLLLAKLCAGLVSMLVTFIVTGGTLLAAVQSSSFASQLQAELKLANLSVFGGAHIWLFAIDFAIYFMFFYMIYLLFSRFFGGFLSFSFTFILFGGLTYLWGLFTETSLHQTLTGWGEIQFNGFVFKRSFDASGMEVFTELDMVHVFLGSYLFEAVIVVLLFIAASWMLDRKVEV
ncbi:hypothetical protein [Sediminibacillus albus]|uniref:ABC-2 type transport system permease protein n=1 Tax=Sediminibacillus albus TaxID=407036 RepID=A0A1G8Y9A4_9BACI|nr:hypothetical protein [Sediminibacillus albus]SDJ99311.1 hypothetical protein SAMN05216243_1478 [Sediminibacillus albus]